MVIRNKAPQKLKIAGGDMAALAGKAVLSFMAFVRILLFMTEYAAGFTVIGFKINAGTGKRLDGGWGER